MTVERIGGHNARRAPSRYDDEDSEGSEEDWIEHDNIDRSKLSRIINDLVGPRKNRVRYDVDMNEVARLERMTGGDIEKEERASELLAIREDKRQLKHLRDEEAKARSSSSSSKRK